MTRSNCMICGYLTIEERGAYEICPVCSWEDDGVIGDLNSAEGGPNGELSINEARKNFNEWGVIDIGMVKNVRGPEMNKRSKDLPLPEA